MASSLLALLDDIGSILDDVSVLTKVAARKTAGVLGDDLALNAQQVTGVRAERELPVVWSVAKGSLLNKAILVPAALAISGVAPWAVTPLLMLGGAFLCFEGAEKVLHRLLHSRQEDDAHEKELLDALANEQVDLRAIEKDKIRGAIRTDFVLSAEIIVIALGTVAGEDFVTRVTVLVAIAIAMTAGVYGLVAAIVKLDDLGLYLHQRASAAAQAVGRGILRAAPWLMKGLSVAGTFAMFLVGGSILEHGLPALHHAYDEATADAGPWKLPLGMLFHLATGAVAGGILVGVYALVRKARGKPALPA